MLAILIKILAKTSLSILLIHAAALAFTLSTSRDRLLLILEGIALL